MLHTRPTEHTFKAKTFYGEDGLDSSGMHAVPARERVFKKKTTTSGTGQQIGVCNTLREHGLELRRRGIQITNNVLTCSLCKASRRSLARSSITARQGTGPS